VAFAAVLSAGLFAPAVRAAVHVVTANPDMTFTPDHLTVYQGESVRFVNGGGVHNVHADDDSFVCALDCSLHTTPNASAWQVSVRFTRIAEIGYYCEQHGDTTTGMRGSITVIDRVFVDGFDAVGG